MHTRGRFGALALTSTLILGLVLAACSSGAGAAPPSDAPSDAPSAPPSRAPDPTAPAAPPSDGGGDDGDALVPDGAKVIDPKPGQAVDVKPVPAETLTARLDGRRLTVAVTWWSGVEPCSVLDTVIVDAEDGGFAITLREGRGPEDVACIMIAEQHVTFIEFPNDLVPGTYTIRDATGGAPAIEVIVP